MYLLGNFLIKLKNAQSAKKESVTFRYSKNIFNIAKLLAKNNFVGPVLKKEKNGKYFVKVKLLYKNDLPLINNLKLISKPSRRVYASYQQIRPVNQGYGIGIISTNQGILSDKEARQRKIGGEYIAQVW